MNLPDETDAAIAIRGKPRLIISRDDLAVIKDAPGGGPIEAAEQM